MIILDHSDIETITLNVLLLPGEELWPWPQKALVRLYFPKLDKDLVSALELRKRLFDWSRLLPRAWKARMSSCCFPAEEKDHSGVTLIPNRSFVPKYLRSLFKPKVIQMYVSYSHPLVGDREVKMSRLLIGAWTNRFRFLEQRCICFRDGLTRMTLSKKHLALCL